MRYFPVLLCLMLLPSGAQAFFDYIPKAKQETPAAGAVLEKTLPDTQADEISKASRGKQVPLALALQLAKPEGWQVQYCGAVDRDKPVTWDSRSVDDAAKAIGEQADVTVDPSFVMQALRVMPKGMDWWGCQEAEKESVDRAAQELAASKEQGLTQAPAQYETPLQVSVAPLPSLKLEAGALKPQLEAFASAEGYQVVWKAPNDFILSAAATFYGSLREVLDSLIRGMRSSGAEISATIFEGNKVVVVQGGAK